MPVIKSAPIVISNANYLYCDCGALMVMSAEDTIVKPYLIYVYSCPKCGRTFKTRTAFPFVTQEIDYSKMKMIGDAKKYEEEV